MKPFTTIAVAIFAIIALVHLVRLFTKFSVVIGGNVVPGWVSVAGVVLFGGLAWMLWREAKG